MNHKKLSEGLTYCFIGIIFLLLTFNVIFPLLISLIKLALYFIGGLCILGGLITTFESFKKPKL